MLVDRDAPTLEHRRSHQDSHIDRPRCSSGSARGGTADRASMIRFGCVALRNRSKRVECEFEVNDSSISGPGSTGEHAAPVPRRGISFPTVTEWNQPDGCMTGHPFGGRLRPQFSVT